MDTDRQQHFETPPPIPEDLLPKEEWYEPYVRYGLYFAAAFQLLCILALFMKNPNKSSEDDRKGLFESESSSSEDESSSPQRSGRPTSSAGRNTKRRVEKKKKK